MKIKELFKQFARSPTSIKLAIFAVILIWLVPFAVIIAGLIFYWEQQGVAQQPTPGGVIPTITLEPATGSPGASVTIRGEGWPADSPVFIYLMAPDDRQIPTYAVAGAMADATGRFTSDFLFPVEARWEGQDRAMVIAQTPDGSISAQANFKLALPEGWLATTPTPPPAATATPAPIETEEPTVTLEPTPLPTPVIPTRTPAPQPAPPSVTATTNLNIRSGPGVAYSIIGLLRGGQTAEASGISPDAGWWQIKFPGVPGEYGWVSARYVTTQNVMNVPVAQAPPLPVAPTPIPTPPPTPVPTPVIFEWRGEYYNNRSLAGPPVLVRNDGAIDFNWGTGSPAAGLPADNFSVRWTRHWSFGEGTYRFHVLVDDGVRLYVDEVLIIDSWQDGGWREVIGERWLWAGPHSLRVEYYEHSGDALIRAWAEQIRPAERPEARFDADPRSGRMPLRVEFDNESRGQYDRCDWDFGDDHDSDDCDDRRHTYEEAGEYTVRLKVSGPGGSDSEKKEDYITVRPVAQFTASSTSGPQPLTVTFFNQSTPHELSEWSFGDGATSTEENPTHTYLAAGIYGVSLRVKEAGVWSDPETRLNYIRVSEPALVAAFMANPTSGQAPLRVQFTDQSSGVIAAWLWNFGDETYSIEQSPAHTYTLTGVYTASLTVIGPGGSDTSTMPGYISVAEPTTPEPPTTTPEPPTATPVPPTPTPEPPTSTPEPPTPTPEPPTPTPEPPTATPVPPTPTPEPPTATPEPPTATPVPPTPTPEPPTPTPEPPTATPELPTATPEPPTPTPEPPIATPEPSTLTPEPALPTLEPPITIPKPPAPTLIPLSSPTSMPQTRLVSKTA